MKHIYEDIRTCFFDLDGVLTNGDYQISYQGVVTKTFFTRDFYALGQLLKKGIKVIILTQSHDECIIEQIRRIRVNSPLWKKKFLEKELRIYTQIENKKEAIENYLKEYNLKWENIAYMGDAENDIECLELAGIAACPKDAIKEIEDVDFRSDSNGGRGAVYEFCKWLLKMRKN